MVLSKTLSNEDKTGGGGDSEVGAESRNTVVGKIEEKDTEDNKAAISVAQPSGKQWAREIGQTLRRERERRRVELSAEQQHSSVALVLKVDVHHDSWRR